MPAGVETCDVLIVGTGLAGLRAAIEAHDGGADVLLVGKSVRRKAHSVMAEGGVAAALGNVDAGDSWRAHALDTLREGQLLGHWRSVEILCQEIIQRVLELERWGALFDRTPHGKIAQRAFGAHTHKRTCYVGDRTGLELMQVLQEQVDKRNIEQREEVFVTSLLTGGGNLSGATAVNLSTGEFFAIRAKAVVLCTGGAGRLYRVTSNSREVVGNGHALAYRAGAELQDMEMVQFHPTGMVHPKSAAGLLVTESVRGEGGRLYNANGERFMERYDPQRLELGPRDLVTRAVWEEIKAGRGTEHGGVWLDIAHQPAALIRERLPSMHQQFLKFADLDITKERMEVAPTAHYTMGGVRVDPEWGATRIRGLYAAGEATGGIHGANRLGGNSLADVLVFGRRAGLVAARHAKGTALPSLPKGEVAREQHRLTALLKPGTGPNPYALQRSLREVMWTFAGIERERGGLERALRRVRLLARQAQRVRVPGGTGMNPAWALALDLQDMALVAEVVIRSALRRTETRGAHYRTDHPERNDSQWLANILCQQTPRGMRLRTEPVPRPPGDSWAAPLFAGEGRA